MQVSCVVEGGDVGGMCRGLQWPRKLDRSGREKEGSDELLEVL